MMIAYIYFRLICGLFERGGSTIGQEKVIELLYPKVESLIPPHDFAASAKIFKKKIADYFFLADWSTSLELMQPTGHKIICKTTYKATN